MNRHQLERCRRIAAALAIALLLLHGAARAEQGNAAITACGASISTCGCTITKPGVYTVTTNLSSTQGLTATGDCIDIKASNVILNGHNFNITGPGSGTSTGAGINVLKGAGGAFIDTSNTSGWKYGLQLQGKNTIVGNVGSGNNVVGVFLDGATGANINEAFAVSNTVYGVWIRGGKANQINSGISESNTGTGLYIGCHDDDTRGTACKGVMPSSGNRIYELMSQSNGDAGVVIDLGNKGNVVRDVEISGNSGVADSIDENPGCGTDQWIENGNSTFGVTSQSCIP